MSMKDEITELMRMASELDEQAREARRAAGRVLSRLRSETPSLEWNQAVRHLGIDPRTAELLIEMACGGRECR
ncbi:MAG: hypothetical protein RBU21_10220 [FCB group bacterium]|jgi:predicted LPLAT superfamily acyltransferase|nr:hypothetical protein [FCB group bacterium]